MFWARARASTLYCCSCCGHGIEKGDLYERCFEAKSGVSRVHKGCAEEGQRQYIDGGSVDDFLTWEDIAAYAEEHGRRFDPQTKEWVDDEQP